VVNFTPRPLYPGKVKLYQKRLQGLEKRKSLTAAANPTPDHPARSAFGMLFWLAFHSYWYIRSRSAQLRVRSPEIHVSRLICQALEVANSVVSSLD